MDDQSDNERIGSMSVGGRAAIATTGKGERLSQLLEVIGIISALILALAVEGFAGIGPDEWNFIAAEHGEDHLRVVKWRFCVSILTVGVLCIVVLFSVSILSVHVAPFQSSCWPLH